MALRGELDELAKDMVGDGKSPNYYFVSHQGPGPAPGAIVTAMFRDAEPAIAYAKASGGILVEDRKSGEVWFRD